MATLTFTPLQQKILKILADGQPHTRAELWECLPDSGVLLAEGRKDDVRLALNDQLKRLRRKMRSLDGSHDIVCEVSRYRLCYRHVILIKPRPVPKYEDTYLG